MGSKATSVLGFGFGAIVIDIECHLSNGLPNIIIVGFANKAVDEAKERIRSSFISSNLLLPKKRITINLAPADLPKESTSLDLAIAVSVMHAGGIVNKLPGNTIIIGELALDGRIRAVRGIIGMILGAKKAGYTNFIIPKGNLEQARLIPDVAIFPVRDLKQLYGHLLDESPIETATLKPTNSYQSKQAGDDTSDFKDIAGQASSKRALEIAASGNHNILLNGPPGTGKSMLAKAVVGILPPMSSEEILEVTHLHSLNNRNFESIIVVRPFRAPHHTASDTAIIGGGRNPRPGEISLAHHGVLFFDELPEFHRTTLEALRQPLEDSIINVSRAKETVQYPANFMFIATANPCPCGYWGTDKNCSCLPYQVIKYQRKLSGPILDRIDMYSDVDNTPHDKLLKENSGADSNLIAARVKKARDIQTRRFGSSKKSNSSMTNRDIKRFAKLSEEATSMLNQAAAKIDLSPRSYMRTIKVARTIADLGGSTQIKVVHIAEALQFRPKRIGII